MTTIVAFRQDPWTHQQPRLTDWAQSNAEATPRPTVSTRCCCQSLVIDTLAERFGADLG